MPRLLVQRTKRATRPTPPCGRTIPYLEPHSPFQRLIDGRRSELGFSGRGLARALKISQSTLWIWLHSVNGFPHPKAFKEKHLLSLAHTLKIPEAEIKTAIDASRLAYTPQAHPMPHASKDAMRTFIDILARDQRATLTRSYVLNLARNLYNGATGEKA